MDRNGSCSQNEIAKLGQLRPTIALARKVFPVCESFMKVDYVLSPRELRRG